MTEVPGPLCSRAGVQGQACGWRALLPRPDLRSADILGPGLGGTPDPLPCPVPSSPVGGSGEGPSSWEAGLPVPSASTLLGWGAEGVQGAMVFEPLGSNGVGGRGRVSVPCHPLPLRLTTLWPRSCKQPGHREARPPTSVQTYLLSLTFLSLPGPPREVSYLWKVGLTWMWEGCPHPRHRPAPLPTSCLWLRPPHLCHPSALALALPRAQPDHRPVRDLHLGWAVRQPKSLHLLEAAASTLTCSPAPSDPLPPLGRPRVPFAWGEGAEQPRVWGHTWGLEPPLDLAGKRGPEEPLMGCRARGRLGRGPGTAPAQGCPHSDLWPRPPKPAVGAARGGEKCLSLGACPNPAPQGEGRGPASLRRVYLNRCSAPLPRKPARAGAGGFCGALPSVLPAELQPELGCPRPAHRRGQAAQTASWNSSQAGRSQAGYRAGCEPSGTGLVASPPHRKGRDHRAAARG